MSRSKPGGLIRKVAVFALLTVAVFYGCCTFALIYLRSFEPPTTAVQIERRVEAIVSRKPYVYSSEWMPLSKIPAVVQHAVIAAEDGAFYAHHGVDWDEFEIAVDDWRTEGKQLRGASTLTQQLVKNLFLTTSRSPIRKVVEWTLAPLAELILSKDRILELYLNEIEWGPGVWGAAAASQYHYHEPLDSLTREQAARLAACIPSPRLRRPSRMDRYSGVILERMEGRGW